MGNKAQKIIRAQRVIREALEDGRLSPGGALWWARRSVAGDDLSFLRRLTAAPGGKPDKTVLAHSNEHVLNILSQALSGDASPGKQGEHGEYDNSGLIEYGDSLKGSAGEITDEEASILFPPKTAQERDRQSAIRQRMGAARAAAMAPWDTEDLHQALFGNHSFSGEENDGE